MPTFITTIQFTEQGVRAARETTKRAGQLKAAAKKMKVKVADVYWTLGAYDGLLIVDAPDEVTVTALMLNLASKGNVRTTTVRAFDAAEMDAILSKMGG